MPVQAILTALLLPPLLLVLLAAAGGLLALYRRRLGAGLVLAAVAGQLLLATPFVSGHLLVSLETGLDQPADPENPPRAVIILSADAAHAADGSIAPGPLTLERLAAGARLARRESLPILVTGGRLSPADPPIATAMAVSLAADLVLPPRWVEPAARDTSENALFSAELLRRDSIFAAYLVTHAWHMRRSLDAFARAGFAVSPAPVRLDQAPDGRLAHWIPRPDHWATSWFALREWAGRLVYRLRDGPPVAPDSPRQ